MSRVLIAHSERSGRDTLWLPTRNNWQLGRTSLEVKDMVDTNWHLAIEPCLRALFSSASPDIPGFVGESRDQ
jgi:hypothetical protein